MRWACLSAAALGLVVTSARAGLIYMDPDGPAGANGVVGVDSIDLLPGNLLTGFNPSTQTLSAFYQARVGSLQDANGNIIPVPGLNSTFELTAVFGVDLVGTGGASGGTFDLAPTSANRYFSMYYNPSLVANDLAGTGFRTGQLILLGSVGVAHGVTSILPNNITPLDLFGPDNYPGINSLVATGGSIVAGSVAGADAGFFAGVDGSTFVLSSGLASPFLHANPAGSFTVGPDGSPFVTVTPDIGPLNGAGTQSLAEADASVSFLAVPEPALGAFLPMLLLAGFRRGSRQRRPA